MNETTITRGSYRCSSSITIIAAIIVFTSCFCDGRVVFPQPHTTSLHIKKNQSPFRTTTKKQQQQQQQLTWDTVSRGGDITTPPTTTSTTPTSSFLLNLIIETTKNLQTSLRGPKSDTLLLLSTTALNTPLCKFLKFSPILGFLLLGLLLGPNGLNLIADVHKTELLADLGVVLFLFEMGIHLSFSTLMSMRRDVFGLGLSQFLVTAMAVFGVCKASVFGKTTPTSTGAAVIIGGGLALSSSAFVLQLLKDKDELGSRFGKASFGVLLLQDLMVVPLLVVTPLLAGGGEESVGVALTRALIGVVMALGGIGMFGKFLLNPLFGFVEKGSSQEAYIGLILATVLGMSFLTEGLGLSNTLGAFLAGVLLSDTKFRHDVEREVSPFRGILVGLFFFSVGFEIDLQLIMNKLPLVAAIVVGIVVSKTVIAAGVALAFGLKMPTAQRVGLILSQGGEFAFVAFRMARNFGILDDDLTKLMLTCVSLTMVTTPFLEEFGASFAKVLEEKELKKAD